MGEEHRELLGYAIEDSTPNADGTHTVKVQPVGACRFDGVAIEDIRIGARVSVEIDTATGRVTVRPAKGSDA